MTNYLDRSIESLLDRRELAEKATLAPWETDYRKAYVFTPPPEQIMIAEMRGIGDGLDVAQRQANASHIAANDPLTVIADIDEILRLRAQVERLEKEADWLISEKIVEECNGCFVGAFNADKGGLVVYESQAVAVASWREAARKAVEEVK